MRAYRLFTILLTAVMIAACSTVTTSEPIPPIDLSISQMDREAMKKNFQRHINFWRKKGVLLDKVRLTILGEGEKTECLSFKDAPEHDVYLTSQQISRYCPGNKKVVITALDLYRSDAKIAQEWLIAHEVGHAVQDSKKLLSSIIFRDKAAHYRVELGATCYAGRALTGLSSVRLTSFISLIREGAMDRADDYIKALSAGDCTSYA